MSSRAIHTAILFAFLSASGCAVHRPLQTWRLVKQDTSQVLIPPDVKAADLSQRTLKLNVPKGHRACPPVGDALAIKVHSTHALVTVTRNGLAKQPPGSLGAWGADLEEQHCVAPGEGMKLAARIAESVPLEPSAAFQLLYSYEKQTTEVDIGPQSRLQVVSPILRQAGLGIMAEGPYKVEALEGNDRSLIVTGKSTDNVLGYETAIYTVQRRSNRTGYVIAPLYADRTLQGNTERRPQPALNYLQFPADAAFYRLFYKSGENDYTALIIAARTPAELDESTKILEKGGALASCQMLHSGMCIATPKAIAVRPMIAVIVNGTEVLVFLGGNVSQAIHAAGEAQPATVLPRLKVFKPWNGRLTAVAFDPSNAAILRLPLRGGETISWK